MAFGTLLNAQPVIHGVAADITDLIYGTVQFGTTWGQVKKGTIKRTGDVDVLSNNRGGLRAALLRNPRSEVTIDVVWQISQAGPTLGGTITIPVLATQGMVVDMSGEWEENGYRGLTITATAWDTLNDATVAPAITPATAAMNSSGVFA
jgi:hypothetical protein